MELAKAIISTFTVLKAILYKNENSPANISEAGISECLGKKKVAVW